MIAARNTHRFLSAEHVTLFALVTICVLLSGCGNGLAEVSGVVTLDGQPLHGNAGDVRITVQFQPVDGHGPTAFGHADENGAYTLSTGSEKGVPPGEYTVSCAAVQIVPAKNPDATPGGRRLTDPKYANAKTSGLKFIVQPGKNEFNLPLESGPKKPFRTGA